MMYNHLEKVDRQETEKKSELVSVCGVPVRLVFAEKKNQEIPLIVGRILKDAYRQRQCG